jgi:outer membrane protein assembly factor BamB
VIVDKETVYGVSGLLPEVPIMVCALGASEGELRWEKQYRRIGVPLGPLVLARSGRALLPPTDSYDNVMLISLDDSKHELKYAFGLSGTRFVAAGDDLIYGNDAAYVNTPDVYIRPSPDLPVVTENIVYLPAFDRQSTCLSARSRQALKIKGGRFIPVKDRKGDEPPPEGEVLWNAWKKERMTALILAGGILFSGGYSLPEVPVENKKSFVVGKDKIYATSATDGKELWSAEVTGEVRDLAFNGGRLVVVCGKSKIVCFGDK